MYNCLSWFFPGCHTPLGLIKRKKSGNLLYGHKVISCLSHGTCVDWHAFAWWLVTMKSRLEWLGRVWVNPTLIMTTANVCLYLTFSPAFVAPWFPRSMYILKCSMYSGKLILTCSRVWFTTEQQGSSLGECADTWYKWNQPTETVVSCPAPFRRSSLVPSPFSQWAEKRGWARDYWDSGAVAVWQLANMPVWPGNNWWAAWTVLLFFMTFILT